MALDVWCENGVNEMGFWSSFKSRGTSLIYRCMFLVGFELAPWSFYGTFGVSIMRAYSGVRIVM